MGLFNRSHRPQSKSFVERNPHARALYNSLTPGQRRVLDEVSFREQAHLEADRARVMERLKDGGFVQIPHLSSSRSHRKLQLQQLEQECDLLAQTCLRTIRTAPLTINVPYFIFNLDSFANSEEVKTVWTRNAKGWEYMKGRAAKEEELFGYQVDWSVSLEEASRDRPVSTAVNYVRHPYGGAGNAEYGHIVLELEPAVKLRSTFIPADTFAIAGPEVMCTYAQLDTLLANLDDSQFKALVEYAQGRYVLRRTPPLYVEANVQGGVQWARDLAKIIVRQDPFGCEKKPEYRQAMRSLAGFARKYGVEATVLDKSSPTTVIGTIDDYVASLNFMELPSGA